MKNGQMANRTTESIRTLKAEIEQTTDPGERSIRVCMVIVLAASEVGACVDRLIEHTGYTREVLEVISHRMQSAQIWTGESVAHKEWKTGNEINMNIVLLHSMVAQGVVFRRQDPIRGYVYSAARKD